MARVKKKSPMRTNTILREGLRRLVEQTYDGSRLYIGTGVNEDCDFRQGLTLNRSAFIAKEQVLQIIDKDCFDPVSLMPEQEDYFVLRNKIYLSRSSLSDNRIYLTPKVPEGYFRHECKYNSHLHVFIKLNKDANSISFLLGACEKTLQLEEHSNYVSKPSGHRMYCITAEDLNRHIHDDFWNPRMVHIGRHVLGLDAVV